MMVRPCHTLVMFQLSISLTFSIPLWCLDSHVFDVYLGWNQIVLFVSLNTHFLLWLTCRQFSHVHRVCFTMFHIAYVCRVEDSGLVNFFDLHAMQQSTVVFLTHWKNILKVPKFQAGESWWNSTRNGGLYNYFPSFLDKQMVQPGLDRSNHRTGETSRDVVDLDPSQKKENWNLENMEGTSIPTLFYMFLPAVIP